MFALVPVLLLILAAFGVDLGNAYAHKRERQKDADHSTLAGTGVGGANLPAPTSAATCSYGKAAVAGDQAVKDVAAYLTKQLGSTVTPGSLVDCQVEQNGEVFYGKPSKTSTGWSLAYDQYKLSLVSPPDTVEFGMANIMGVDSVNVRGQATAAIGTPGGDRTFPAFATDGCDWGQRTVYAPAGATTGPSFTPGPRGIRQIRTSRRSTSP